MLYAIGDLHLSLGTDKPMDVFGGGWENYIAKLEKGFSILNEEDLCVICGDISWGMSLEDSLADFRFIDRLPGRKLIIKGNHDFWWATKRKLQSFLEENQIDTIGILHNDCVFYHDIGICGTRGWFYEEEKYGEHDRKIMNRELIRLETSLKAAEGARERICFLHYPPRFGNYVCREIVELLQESGVHRCYYGHIHGKGHRSAVQGPVDGIEYHMVSADFLQFVPKMIANR